MNRPHFRRHPRPTDPASDVSWQDRKAECDAGRECPTCATLRARANLHATLRAGRTRYDAEWPDVLAAEGGLALRRALDEAVLFGGDLAAMAAPLTDWGVDWRYVDAPADQSGFTPIADWPVWDYGEGYDIESEATLLSINADALIEMDTVRVAGMARDDLGTYAEPAHGRHRQTSPLDLLLADLRDIEDRLS